MSVLPLILNDLNEGNLEQLRARLQTLLPSEIVEIVEHLSPEHQLTLFSLLDTVAATRVFELLPVTLQKALINTLPSNQAASILNQLAPDDLVALLEELPGSVVQHLIKLLSPEERALTLKLMGYAEGSVGRLMTPDYIAIKLDWTVEQVLDYIRKYGRDSETVNVLYVIDDQGRLIDDIRIRELLLANLNQKISEISDKKFISLYVNDKEDTAVELFRKYNRVALPVTDNQGYLLGIVTYDDVFYLAQEEDTENIQRIGGTVALDEPYMSVPFLELMRKRAGWLTVLFLGEMLTASAMSFFEEEISKAVVLALFIPLIISSGGNSGSQASTLIIRALTLGEIKLRDWWRIVRREFGAGLFLGTILAAIAFFRIYMWTLFSNIYGEHWFLVATTVALTLIGIVTWGTLSGSMLPIILKRLGADPAVSSAPFVATLIDVTGIVIYFCIAMIVLKGTLL